jgi:hypothetical protein
MNPPPDYTTLDQLFKSNLTFWFLICSLKSQSFFKTSGSFTIDSSTPTLTTDKKKHLYSNRNIYKNGGVPYFKYFINTKNFTNFSKYICIITE